MNTANKLTMLRIVLIPIFLAVLYVGFPYAEYVAVWLFIFAGVTDIVDGRIARKRGEVTDFGKLMDPLADKMLVLALILWFVAQGMFPVWAALAVMMREYLVTAIRMVAKAKGRTIPAGLLGKIKTVVTMIALPFLFLPLVKPFEEYLDWTVISPWLKWSCVILIVTVTTISGVEYAIKNRHLLDWKK